MEKQTPVKGQTPETKLQHFTPQQLPADQLKSLKGGDGEDPPEDGIIHEDILDI